MTPVKAGRGLNDKFDVLEEGLDPVWTRASCGLRHRGEPDDWGTHLLSLMSSWVIASCMAK